MNEEKQRIKIAEARGWATVRVEKHREHHLKTYEDTVVGDRPTTRYFGEVPNYLHDLNAMHDAVMSLSVEQRTEFRKQLKGSGLTLMGKKSYDEWFFATAAQRAEAFLKTLGLWEEEG